MLVCIQGKTDWSEECVVVCRLEIVVNVLLLEVKVREMTQGETEAWGRIGRGEVAENKKRCRSSPDRDSTDDALERRWRVE